MTFPSISIITVVFNGARTIKDTLDSVASQTYPALEHIVVDGGSTDGTVEILAHHEGQIRWISEPDRGIFDAMNKGIHLATGDVVGFLNADDLYADDSVLEQVAAAFSDSSTDACYSDLVYVDTQDIGKVIRYWRSQPFRPGLFETGWMPAHPTFFVRRRIYKDHGGFDLSFPLQTDFELTMRLLETKRIKATYTPRIWVRMRIGGVSNSRLSRILKGNIEAYRICRKHGLPVSPFFVVRKILSRVPQFFCKPK